MKLKLAITSLLFSTVVASTALSLTSCASDAEIKQYHGIAFQNDLNILNSVGNTVTANFLTPGYKNVKFY
jgi:hypothetical protein